MGKVLSDARASALTAGSPVVGAGASARLVAGGKLDRKLRLRAWKPGDERAFTPRADLAEEFAANRHDWAAGAPGPTWTLLRWSGEVVGVGGAYQHDDAFEMWACLAELPRRDWPQAIWLAERAIQQLSVRPDTPRRFVATCRQDLRGGVGVLQRLGFEFSGHVDAGPAGARYIVMGRRA